MRKNSSTFIRLFLTICFLVVGIICFRAEGAFAEPGKIVVNNDEWTLSNEGFDKTPDDAAQFALNVANYFTGGTPGNFLVYTTPFGLTNGLVGCKLENTMKAAGHTWTIISTTTYFSLDDLLQYDGIFLAGSAAGNFNSPPPVIPPDTQLLIDYVKAGGNIYLAGGTDPDLPKKEADQWNPFLSRCGLRFQPVQNDVNGIFQINSSHPIFDGVKTLFQRNGNSIIKLDPSDLKATILFGFQGKGLYAICSFTEFGPQIVNNLVTFEPIKSTCKFTSDTTGCSDGFVGKFRFDARLTNTRYRSLSDFVVQVVELTKGNLLKNADDGPGGVGSILTVEKEDDYKDGVLNPRKFVNVPFEICTKVRERFRFFVDVWGIGKASPCPPAGSVAVADFNLDGIPDIAKTGFEKVSVLLGSGDGTFQDQQDIPIVGAKAFMTVADLNEDGAPDLVRVSNTYMGVKHLTVLLGNGDGTFQILKPLFIGSSINFVLSMVVGDLSGNGHLDLFIAITQAPGIASTTETSTLPGVLVLLGNGDGTFQIPGLHQPSRFLRGMSSWLADLNGDNILDLITIRPEVSIALGNGDGTFEVMQTFSSGNPLDMAHSLEMAYLNADGFLDLVSVANSELSVILSNSDGTFRDQEQQSLFLPVKAYNRSMKVADLNEDGVPDLIVVSDSYESVEPFPISKLRRFLTVLLGTDDGDFQVLEPLLIGKEEEGIPSSEIVAADLNNNGHLDLVLSPLVLLGNGDGTFNF